MPRHLIARVRRLPGLFDSDNPETTETTDTDPEELVIPDDLAELSDDDLQALHDQAVEVFNQVYGDGTDLTDEDFETLSTLTQGVERLRSEINERTERAEQRASEAQELASRVNADEDTEPDPDQTDPENGDGEGTDTPPGTETTDNPEAPAEQPEAIAASSNSNRGRSPLRVNLSGLRSRQSAPSSRPVTEPQSMRDLVTAAPDLPGYSNGQGLDWDDIGRAIDNRLRGFNPGTYESARRANREMRQQFGVAVVRKPVPSDLTIQSNDPAHIDEVMTRAVDESRLPGGSLVAAGGWCAPSQTVYDLMELESRDGLLSLPEVGISRGGIQFTAGPDFQSLFTGVGFSYSEDQDIAGSYSGGTNEIQQVAISGAPTGGDFTLTYDGQTTAAIAFDATAADVEAALLALDNIPAGSVAGTGGPLPGTAVNIEFVGDLAGLDVSQMTATGNFTGGTSPAVTVTTTQAGVPGTGGKPCFDVPCPDFTERRLGLSGVCVSAGLLEQRGFPEVLARTTRGVMVGHDHRVARDVINSIIGESTQVSLPTGQVGATAPILTAIELQTEHYRYVHRMPRGSSLEAVFPFWVYGAIRSDLSRRLGVDFFDVSDARINGWFAQRGIAAQFVYNWQDITGGAGGFIAWPTEVKFLLYAAGTWVKGTSDIISLDTIFDSTNLSNNEFTALFTEEGWLTAKMGHDSRVVTVPITADGSTHEGELIAHNGTAG